MFPSQPAPIYAQAQQIQRHEIAQIRQLIQDLEYQRANVYHQAVLMGQNITTHEDQLTYAGLLGKLNQLNSSLGQYSQILNQMLSMATPDFSRSIPDQVKREVYHLYHAGRYTQDQLAEQYSIGQSTVNKIVNGPAPDPI